MAARKKTSATPAKNEQINVALDAGDDSVTAKAVNLFPTTIWMFSASTACQKALPAMQNAADKLYKGRSKGSEQGPTRQQWRFDSPHELKEFGVLNQDIQRSLSIVCQQLRWEPTRRAFECWLSVLPTGEHHVCHHHSPNLLSGVAYLDAINAESGRLILRDPRPGRSMFSNTQLGPVDVPVEAEAGSILIFPAWLEHCVEVNNRRKSRRAIAFNLGSQLR